MRLASVDPSSLMPSRAVVGLTSVDHSSSTARRGVVGLASADSSWGAGWGGVGQCGCQQSHGWEELVRLSRPVSPARLPLWAQQVSPLRSLRTGAEGKPGPGTSGLGGVESLHASV